MTTIVGVSGPVRAGKSTVAKGAAAAAGERVGFGGYLRRVAAERGIPERREDLQTLGEELLAELGPDEFAARVLADAPTAETMFVDGVRHLSINDALARRADRYLLIYVELDGEARRARLQEFDGPEADMAAIDSHSTERDVPALRELADLIVSGGDSRAWEQVVALLG